MTVVELAEDRMQERCLAWLEHRSETELPVLLYSGGPFSEDARYHILASRPRFLVTGTVGHLRDGSGGRVQVLEPDGEIREEAAWEELLPLLRRLGKKPREHGSPFHCGFLGYIGYDLAWVFEYGLPRYLAPSSALPDLWLGWYEEPVVLDRRSGQLSGARHPVREILDAPSPTEPEAAEVIEDAGVFHREEYEAAVERVREHCYRGDLFQADLSRRITLRVSGSSVDLFGRLLRKSPSPFSAYVGLGDGRAVVSSSPEEFFRVRGRRLRSRPIKGTRPRGRDPVDDERLRMELLSSEKDLAELTMIVDLVRNDLGRVARPGSVQVREFPVLLTLPQVFHLFGTVEAELDEGRDAWDLLAASFPPGSVSGAPKPKSVEILEIVERSRRGVYTGAIGYLEPGGNS
ncbi:MAG: anthranilate synthase component I family protein, partial [Planctomycetota bacterium]